MKTAHCSYCGATAEFSVLEELTEQGWMLSDLEEGRGMCPDCVYLAIRQADDRQRDNEED